MIYIEIPCLRSSKAFALTAISQKISTEAQEIDYDLTYHLVIIRHVLFLIIRIMEKVGKY